MSKKLFIALILMLCIAFMTRWTLFSKPSTVSISDASVIDVAIIGGGVAGLYTAYRLSDPATVAQTGMPHIAIFEAMDRLGGRILTVEIPDSGGLKAELGAMRFLDNHVNAMSLLTQQFHVPIEKADGLRTQLFHYIRGKKILYTDYHNHPEIIPYHLIPSERGKTPTELYLGAMEAIVPEAVNITSTSTLAKILQAKKIPDDTGALKPLYEWNFPDLLKKQLSPEGYQLVHDTHGFRAYFTPENAYDIIYSTLQDFAPHEMYKLKGGMSQMVVALTNAVQAQGVKIHLQHALTAIEILDSTAGDPIFVLTIAGKKYYARHVILTISPAALQALDKRSILFSDPRVADVLKNSKRSIPVQKLFFVYDHAWWEDMGLSAGRVHTDLSAHQVFYWGSTPEAALLLAAYRDSPPTWEKGCADPKDFYHNRDVVPMEVQAPLCLVHEMTDEMRLIHYDPQISFPRSALYRDWSLLPIGGGFHRWNVGFKSWELIPFIRKPYPLLNLYIAGDNFGRGTGWIEVAINSAEKLMITHFGLPRAPWIPADYDLGP